MMARGSYPGSFPCIPVRRWLQGANSEGYSASPNGRTCTTRAFIPYCFAFWTIEAYFFRNASSPCSSSVKSRLMNGTQTARISSCGETVFPEKVAAGAEDTADEEATETGEDEDSLRKGSGSALLRPVSTMVRMTASSKRMAPARILCRFKKRILSRSFRFLSSFGTVSILCSA